MHKELIRSAFETAKKRLEASGVKDPSNHQAAIHISDFMMDDIDFAISKRSLSAYYKSAMENPTSEDINISQIRVVQGLCAYLGFASYKDFILHLNVAQVEEVPKNLVDTIEKPTIKNVRTSKRTLLITVGIFALIIAGILMYLSVEKQRWMVWQQDHYVEVDFNKEALATGNLKLLKEERIDNFKKILHPNCQLEFFNPDGSVKVWYGKNRNGTLELFTGLGLHPETEKTLKPITPYMIKKYWCASY